MPTTTSLLLILALASPQQPADAAAAVRATNELGLGLYRALDKEQPAKNLLFAPFSITMALAMLAEGARDETAAELRQAQTAAMRLSYRADVWEAVPELVKVYRLLEQDKQLGTAERADLRFKVRSRLLAVGDQIVSDVRREITRQRRQEAARKRGARLPVEVPAETPAVAASSSGKPWTSDE